MFKITHGVRYLRYDLAEELLYVRLKAAVYMNLQGKVKEYFYEKYTLMPNRKYPDNLYKFHWWKVNEDIRRLLRIC